MSTNFCFVGEQPFGGTCLGFPSPLSNGRMQQLPELSLSQHSYLEAKVDVLSQADFS